MFKHAQQCNITPLKHKSIPSYKTYDIFLAKSSYSYIQTRSMIVVFGLFIMMKRSTLLYPLPFSDINILRIESY